MILGIMITIVVGIIAILAVRSARAWREIATQWEQSSRSWQSTCATIVDYEMQRKAYVVEMLSLLRETMGQVDDAIRAGSLRRLKAWVEHATFTVERMHNSVNREHPFAEIRHMANEPPETSDDATSS